MRALTHWGSFAAMAPSGPRLCPRRRGSAPETKMESLSRAGQEMSLAALKQHDPYITSIADLTGQVALYTFCPKANQWVSPARTPKSPARPPPLKGATRTALGGGDAGGRGGGDEARDWPRAWREPKGCWRPGGRARSRPKTSGRKAAGGEDWGRISPLGSGVVGCLPSLQKCWRMLDR